MLPFTREQFFEVFAAYNAANWPAAILAYPLALVALVFACRGTPNAGRVVGAILALMWGWVGLVYHGLYFSQINPIARVFAAAFLVQAILFAIPATRARGLEFGSPTRRRAFAGAVMVAYAMVAYSLIGLAVGERYPAMPLFGVAPCPLLIFTFGLMLWASSARWWLWIIPLLWSVVGGSAAILLLVPQDWALPISAGLALLAIWLDRPNSVSDPSPNTSSPKHHKGDADTRGKRGHAGTKGNGSGHAS
ncbi:MAG TPA: DUF6064 family protein [Nitrobacter sp.]|nr:DUF6064 family protein [Nitrobacter sp.]